MYPSHIHISFPYSHILPYPYISHIPVFIFLSIPPVALPLVFFHFSFLWHEGGVCFSCGFLCRCCGWFSFRSSFRFSFRLSPRSVLRLASRFAFRPVPSFRFSVRSPFRPSVRFSVWACQGSVCWSRRFCQFFRAGGRLYFLCLGVVAAMWGHVVSLMWSVRWMVWLGVCAGRMAFRVAERVACCSARRWSGRDDRLMVGQCSPCCSFACRSFVFSFRLSGCGGEAIDAPFLSARLGGLSGGGGVVDGCVSGWCAVGMAVMSSACCFFSFLVSGGRGDGVSSRSSSRFSSRVGVPSCVSCRRPVSRIVSFLVLCRGFASRVGVGVSFLVSFLVSCRRPVLSCVSCRCCPVAPFLSARVLVSSRLFSSLSLLLCVFVPSCVSDGVGSS